MLLVTAGVLVGCNRRDACMYCNQTTCGPHSHDGAKGTGGMGPDWPVRHYCEICGERCAKTGACPEHGMAQAPLPGEMPIPAKPPVPVAAAIPVAAAVPAKPAQAMNVPQPRKVAKEDEGPIELA